VDCSPAFKSAAADFYSNTPLHSLSHNSVSNHKEFEAILFLLSVQTGKQVQHNLVANGYDNTTMLLDIDLNHFNHDRHDGN
jgi:hypothetical protein